MRQLFHLFGFSVIGFLIGFCGAITFVEESFIEAMPKCHQPYTGKLIIGDIEYDVRRNNNNDQ